MSTSGSITGVAKSKGSIKTNYTFWADWRRNGSYNIANNTSNITVELKIKRTDSADGAYNLDRKPNVSLVVNGSTRTPTISLIDTRNYVTCTFATWTGDVTHNNDGSLSCPIIASFSHYGSSSLDSGTLSGNADLDTIPRASELTSAADVTLGNKCSVKWTPKAASFRYKLRFALGNWSYTTGAIHPNTTAAYTYSGYTIPLDVANQIASDEGTMTVTLYTYSDSGATAQVGSASSKTFKVTVPDNSNTKPTVSMTLAPVGSLPSAFAGLYIQGKTKVKATLTATGKYGASIKSYSMKADDISYGAADEYTSVYMSKYGTMKVYGYAKDSRGFTGETSKDITIVPYNKPKIQDVEVFRCDANGNQVDDGTYLKIKAKRSYSPVTSNGVQKNFCQIRYRYRMASSDSYSDWATILAANNLSSDAVETGALLNGTLDLESSYVVQVQAIDDIGDYAETTLGIKTDDVYWHRTRNGMGFGKYCEGENLLDVGWDAHFHGEVLIGSTGMTLREYILSVISEGG